MAESRRQKKVAAEFHRAISDLLQRTGSNYYGSRAFVTITEVTVSPDLLNCKIYLSVYNVEEPKLVIAALSENIHEIRHELGKKLRHQVRRIPEIEFFQDDTASKAQNIDDLLKGLDNQA